ncbi:phosphoribosylamine--glycine ligase [Aestuariispira ectoiniformans]|uniref:phosphoribosylamine--glycine ligase n=1 Tax=Aestuariispira ectoiniformans TaxID=2775080 RepID=UPI00223A7776|nr:phosphoribosylamine--glycine ligase [Aestuariispira ectoiniformans]
MKVLVVGSGGREHALCWSLASSPLCDKLYCAPGNAGIADVAECVAIKAEDVDAIVAFAKDKSIDLVVIGPEAPLVLGLADKLADANIRAFGPSAAAAELEGSKGFMKDICAKYGIPTAAYARFTNAESAKAYIREQGAPIVVKTDGLAAGKGVTVAQTLDEALNAVDDAMLNGVFGDAGAEVVVEEFMAGEELSFFAFSDGKSVLPLASAQDHKAVYDGDKGPNTGGMGAYSPAPVCTPEIEQQVIDRCIQPLIDGMAKEGKPYRGVLFCGLMIDETGPRVVEYNVRFGDPECQVLMMRLKSDLLPVLVAACDDVLDTVDLRWHDQAALTVVMAAKGYPGSYEKNTVIENVEAAGADDDVTIFHAGTARADDGSLRATGGRVLNVTARGDTVTAAQARAYEAVDKISWEQGFCRRDIGWRAVEREQQK